MIRRALLVFLVGGSLSVGVSSAQAALTIESFAAETASTLAGAHSDASASFSFLTTVDAEQGIIPSGGNPADLVFNVPAGLIGNAHDVPQCPDTAFALVTCQADTQVGAGSVTVATEDSGGVPMLVPVEVYNLTPPHDAPALLGLQVNLGIVNPQQLITVAAHAADDYAITLTVPDLTRIGGGVLLASSLTLWGVPADPSHDAQRACVQKGSLGCASTAPRVPFLDNATDCAETPTTTFSVSTYEEPEAFTAVAATSPDPTGCASVPFAPSIDAEPDTSQAGAPAGLSFKLTVPQGNTPEGRATAELEKAVVTLPQGMTISPSAASKLLEGCTDEQFGAGSDAPATCPAASVIGEDEVESPLVLPGPLKGKIYLGQPLSTDPSSGQMFRVLQELQGFGLDVKVEGSVVADPQTGQLTATFANLPELPFQTFGLHFNGGPNAVLVNPPTCGAQTVASELFPYSNPTTPATPSSTFTTSYEGAGGACPASLPFAPSSAISTASSQAGALSPLTVSFARADQTQPLGRIEAKLPAGLLGYVSKVALCETAQAVAGTCSAESRVGTVSTSAGAGSDPLTVQGSVYLAHGSNGYPFMLSVVVPAVAGPYDLGNVVVPVWLQVNSDGSITAVSGPLPSILDGIPLDIRSVTMTIDRPGFTFIPTSCNPLAMSGTVTSLAGTVAAISAPFQASGCGSLPFAPSFTVATQGSTSKANGASLTVRITQKPGEADIHSVHTELPIQLPSRLTTLQKACLAAQFASNPAGCPAGSDVGTATAYTPTLSSPLTGPAFLVSHGGAAFPDLEIVLQGEGVTVILDGATDIKKGITSSTFSSVPDVPISGFELNLPEGPYSLLVPDGTLCSSKLLMPTTIVGQSGVVVKQSTRIAVSGCPAVKVIAATVKGATASLTVQVPAAGRLTVSGSSLKHAARMLKQPGRTTVELGLTTAGLASLHSRYGLKVKLKASFTPRTGSGSSASTTVTFR